MSLFNTYWAAVASEKGKKRRICSECWMERLPVKSFWAPRLVMELIIQFCWSVTIRFMWTKVLFAAVYCRVLSSFASLLRVRREAIIRLYTWWPVLAVTVTWSRVMGHCVILRWNMLQKGTFICLPALCLHGLSVAVLSSGFQLLR